MFVKETFLGFWYVPVQHTHRLRQFSQTLIKNKEFPAQEIIKYFIQK